MLRMLPLSLLAFSLLPLCSRGEITNDAIARATAAIQAATPRAQADPAHPIFHVTGPAQWINDRTAPFFTKAFIISSTSCIRSVMAVVRNTGDTLAVVT